MDQASFRQLLQTPTTFGRKKKQKTVDASQPAFKPRTLKKNKGEDYRDRAGERRLGVNNDFAQVEALAEDFERRHAEEEDRRAVDEQRKYLGGDSQHTVLVKGLDYALLEQNRARVAAEAAATEDVSLEQAFLESSVQPKKRTKAEILSELKSKRGAAGAAAPVEADKALEEAKKAGKFKPIGFKPGAEGKVKRKKKVKAGEPEENGERKKKRKVAADATTAPASASVPSEQGGQASATPSGDVGKGAAVAGPSTAKPAAAPNPEPEPVDEDFDIFAGAGEYTGIDLGDDDEGSEVEDLKPRLPEDEEGGLRDGDALRPGKWLATSDDEREPTPPPPAASARDSKSATRSASPQRRPDALHRPPSPGEDGEMDEEAEDRPMRLQPLASSALPSIKDLLAMSEEAEKAEKRKARKEKKKSGGGGGGAGAASEKDTKAKIDRDYQRLKAYTDKKNKT
ncbi:RED-like protein N-terminal region-domain-containing protein [Cerioporus squamosus]|nr:RED-like protein N-terminal region-domain-containing protein [Cerioporus squamosus]